jgi:hypothetical protein
MQDFSARSDEWAQDSLRRHLTESAKRLLKSAVAKLKEEGDLPSIGKR